MIKPYSHEEGVPAGNYYLKEILQFGDFETDEIWRITFISDNKQELIDLCRQNSWHCPENSNDTADCWFTHCICFKEQS